MPLQESDQRLIIYRAADAASQQGLDRLAALDDAGPVTERSV
ncbi:hypothetical protein [Nocardia cyriacigeorgica]|nr:hypothetical protein [Nocardia cyriacigeorgica]